MIAGLTNREAQVLMLYGWGLTRHQVAQELGISPATVKNYQSTLGNKVGVTTRLELAILALRNRAALVKRLERLAA